MELVEIIIKVPKGSEEQIKRKAVEEVKEFLGNQKSSELKAIQAEIDSDYEIIEEANFGKEKKEI